MTAPLLLAFISTSIILQILIAFGVAAWRLQSAKIVSSPVGAKDLANIAKGAWTGWRIFRVESCAFEDPAATQRSLLLAPVDGLPLPDFAPGQYLTFSIDRSAQPDEPERPIVRCYSMSDQPNGKTYRITVKRMPAPLTRPDLPPGEASSFLHDHVQVGDVLKVKAPAGQFVLDTGSQGSAVSDITAVFIAGGIGVTPMMSMILWSLAHQPNRPLHLFYGVRDSTDHAFKSVLEDLSHSHPAFSLHVFYGVPGARDIEGQDFQQSGFIHLDVLKRELPHGPHQFYVCGPPAMMAALLPALAGWGVAKRDLHFESFGPASSGFVEPRASIQTAPLPALLEVQFQRSHRTIGWSGEDMNLLDFAERHAVPMESGCRTGSWGACETRLISGEVRYASKPDFEMSPGACLPCVGIPVSTVVLEA